MNDKDPPPFGYTFNGFFDADLTALDTSGQSLLSDMEHQSLTDFFSNTDPFHLSDSQAFPLPTSDTKDSADDFGIWNNFITPATVHRVSTTIPDQAHLQHGFDVDHGFAQPPLPTNHLGNTHDDLQAATTLFSNSQSSYSNGRSHSFHALPPPNRDASTSTAAESSQTPKPMAFTTHGLINEQLATLIPHHGEHGTIEAQLAAHWAASNAQHQHEAEFSALLHQPSLKRSYTFGTDDSFNNPSGYSAPSGQETEEQVTRRLLRHAQPFIRTGGDAEGPIPGPGPGPAGHIHLPPAFVESPSDDEQSEDGTSEDGDDDDRPVKKRRKSKYRISKSTSRKSNSRNGKSRKMSLAEESSKKKRASAASQKMQRENLTEEQKRSNHILSEQKRRNLIKRGFDDLHDLVPEIRNGGLSKSSVLTEAANFLEKLIQENASFRQLTGDVKVCMSE
ncbi:hypothetical protein P153DRAFT_365456 [Dothidotthia symphoricarpi CBS 119687]|uniref:BHLH domain-containing protein n=1 Tax=Dothidotthia symphoricarpi CBS 119687 TaxID=1392245 RepID=A0A6A6AGA3_9PLEO|nr:uncharacterized protein P153DRAFT_365456 [Dothidotthia symphoricarpi CBS 119687]KAF2130810.1 hypothetical protein P153DRAFT_365456 [Dothidotthia symphoricarpi CBS 119687]